MGDNEHHHRHNPHAAPLGPLLNNDDDAATTTVVTPASSSIVPNVSANSSDGGDGPSVTIHQTTNTVYLDHEDVHMDNDNHDDEGDSAFGDEDV